MGVNVVSYHTIIEQFIGGHHVSKNTYQKGTNSRNAKELLHTQISRPEQDNDGQHTHQPACAGKPQIHGIGGNAQQHQIEPFAEIALKTPLFEEIQDDHNANAHNDRHGMLILEYA